MQQQAKAQANADRAAAAALATDALSSCTSAISAPGSLSVAVASLKQVAINSELTCHLLNLATRSRQQVASELTC